MITCISVMADIIIPCIGSHYINCQTYVKLFWFLHPVLNYLSLYTMIFMRQYFTFRALRETRLKNFIPVEITVISVRLSAKMSLSDVTEVMSPKSETSHPHCVGHTFLPTSSRTLFHIRLNFKLGLSFTFAVILIGFTFWMFFFPYNLVTWSFNVTLEEDCLGKPLIIRARLKVI